MCGISGVVTFNNNKVDVNKIKKMTDCIKHRGPDDEGFYFWGIADERFAYGEDTIPEIKRNTKTPLESLINENFHIGFGHRRLSIIDVTASGHQPMNDSEIVITYNGEIYNYIELRNELVKLGHSFSTVGDTEVIIKSYQQWGENCVNRFNGMWAFAIWDKKNHKVFCSRDRLGEKPFYYHISDNEFIFGSEIKQLISYGVKAKVNDNILASYLISSIHDVSEETFFDGIFVLPAGHNISIEISDKDQPIKLNKNKYWDIENVNERKYEALDFTESSKLVGTYLEKSIELRLRSDVQIGSCLSGGLDSSSIVTLATNRLKENRNRFKTFTACYDNNKEVDERYYSDLVVENSGCLSTKVKPSSEKLQADFKKLVWHQDEPFGSLGIFASWCVMDSAQKEDIKVLLDGQGGDETLMGYERFYAYLLKEKLFSFKFRDMLKEYNLASENSRLSVRHVISYFFYFNNKTIRKMRLSLKAKKFMNKTYFNKHKNLDDLEHLLSFKTMREAQIAELKGFINHLLRYEDRNSMAHSIEARVPFLDPDFVEATFSLSARNKLKEGWTKAPLREYMTGKMPLEVTYRKNKLGFSVPQREWLDELNDHFKESLLEKPRSSKYFNMKYIRNIFNNKTDEKTRFKFIMVETWMRTFDME